MYVCLLLWVYSALRGCHTASPSRSWDQWIRQTFRPHCGYTLIIWLNEQIESEILHGTGSFEENPLMVPLRVHMLSIDYQNHHQIQKIKVIDNTGHPAYWTRHKEISQLPTKLLCHTICRCQRLGVTLYTWKTYTWRAQKTYTWRTCNHAGCVITTSGVLSFFVHLKNVCCTCIYA